MIKALPFGEGAPKGAGEVAVRITVLLQAFGADVLRYHLFHRKRSPFPKGEGFCTRFIGLHLCDNLPKGEVSLWTIYLN